jgi:MerR family transcriptional regulator, thiopeptide resistance regulator
MAWREQALKVGEVARRTGVSVRTLHHYDQIGLLSPASHSPSGHRLYRAADLARLQQILSLRQLGFPLTQIRGLLERPDWSPAAVLELHLGSLRQQIERQQQLRSRLEALLGWLRSNQVVTVDALIDTLKEMKRVEQYYTPEQLAELKQRSDALGEDGMRRAEADWAELIDAIRAEKARGTDPSDPRVRELAGRCRALLEAFTGGNPEIAASLNRLWQQEQNIHGQDTAEMRELMAYVYGGGPNNQP